ncbi:hypothetical protein TRFO_02525 [Tritrichomonas foetus]|uniref:Uncharacterized protein n=1 Tax=Tritrichomonas foetus TaxID=1144522 RepID=A0A1J4L339_9EUKA|nr:hypothetical protein TRFO_02525 [Tritrichomonas foetus]|eukprot:OHT17496.1 hypothetical protein TRFO_02525 [Tritrichomonas foetus]
MIQTKFIYQDQIFVRSFIPSSLNSIHINQFFEEEIKPHFKLDDISNYILFSFKPQEINDQRMSALHLKEYSLVAILEKSDYEDVNNYCDLILPSLLFESTKLYVQNIKIIKSINIARELIIRAFSPDNRAIMLSLMPIKEFNEKSDIELVIAALDWFKNKFNIDPSVKCKYCHSKAVYYRKDNVTLYERDKGAVHTNVFKCPNCGAHIRKPRFLNTLEIVKQNFTCREDNVFLFLSVLKALSVEARIVIIPPRFYLIEFYSTEQQRFIHLDPYQFTFDAPLTYEGHWRMKVREVVAIGEFECVDVTPRYSRRRNSIPTTIQRYERKNIFEKIIKAKNIMYQAYLPPDEKQRINDRQDHEADSFTEQRRELNENEKEERRYSPIP